MTNKPIDFLEESEEIFGPKYTWNFNKSLNIIVYARYEINN